MENEWKDLDIANLPLDILVGDYEFQKYYQHFPSENWKWDGENRLSAKLVFTSIINNIMDGKDTGRYRYRYRQLESPTYEEMAEKWIAGRIVFAGPEWLNKGIITLPKKDFEEIAKKIFIEGLKRSGPMEATNE